MRVIDPKYHIESEQIIKTATGEPVPDDEPLILFRAKDRLALPALGIYKILCQVDHCTEPQIQGVNEIINAFLDFSIKHPERMKQPGITMAKHFDRSYRAKE